MVTPCDLPVLKPNAVIVITDAYSKKMDQEPFEKLPENIRYKLSKIECDGKVDEVLVPVSAIKVSTLDAAGKLVEKEKASSMLIEYFDKNGVLLHVARMNKE